LGEQIADLGFEDDTVKAADDPPALQGLEMSASDYFVWSRVSGSITLKSLLQTSGLAYDEAVTCVTRLRDLGLIVIEGQWSKRDKRAETSRKKDPGNGADKASNGADPSDEAPNWVIPFDDFTFDPADLLEASAVPLEYRKLLIYYEYHLEKITYYDLLQRKPSSSTREITRSYYRLSKMFHPDRWFRKDLGRMDEPLHKIFKWINKAYRTLSKAGRRAEYDKLLAKGYVGPWQVEKRQESGTFSIVPKASSLGRDALVARARKLAAEGELSRAADAYRRALQLTHSHEISMELADTLARGAFDLEEALRCVRAIRSEATGNYAAMLLEAKILKLRGDIDAARELCQKIAAERPEHPGLSDLIEELG